MSDEHNKSYRIRTKVGEDTYLNVNINQEYDTFEVLSLKINQSDVYKLHNSNYGVVVGRVLANGGFGIPNAKVSIFISANTEDESAELLSIYPFTDTTGQNQEGIRYNLLPDESVNQCYAVVGTFPNKRFLLDNDILLEVFDKYYKFTTRTNECGDYLLTGIPTGSQKIHMDVDLSDCGILSQRPRDFVYKGYNIEQFENPNQFKDGKDLNSLSQIFSQDETVHVHPFWGNENLGDTIGITRKDIKVNFKFEPTCVFMGSVFTDAKSNGISKKCIPTNQTGAMDELTTGKGTIEMIRKTVSGDIEEFQIKGTSLIDGNGVFCYQIPMNLDYIMTDEYGAIVPTDDPDKGIPTRASVRFRFSMDDMDNSAQAYFRGKVLVPHNPLDHIYEDAISGFTSNIDSFSDFSAVTHDNYDFEFGTETKDESFRDLFWNNVYSVKQYIPRFQKTQSVRNEKFSGIKHCNIYGSNNPIPYNNIRIRLPLMFTILCALIKAYIFIVRIINDIATILYAISSVSDYALVSISDGLCPDLENWVFAPHTRQVSDATQRATIAEAVSNSREGVDPKSIDKSNMDEFVGICVTKNTDYLIACVEMNLAQEYKVINFDFYNDWLNGAIYFPRWTRELKKKLTINLKANDIREVFTYKIRTRACYNDTNYFRDIRRQVQMCSLSYNYNNSTNTFSDLTTDAGCGRGKQKCHGRQGRLMRHIFGNNGGVITEKETKLQQKVYYYKPCEWDNFNRKSILYATDIILLGSLNDCSIDGLPQAFKHLESTSYILPTNLAQTNMDEDGYLYTDSGGSAYCITSGNVSTTKINPNNYWKAVGPENLLSLTFTGTGGRPSGVTVSDGTIDTSGISERGNNFEDYTKRDGIQYGNNDGSGDVSDSSVNIEDIMPVTEAAGISWNYTGPGQGTASTDITGGVDRLYFPGGHFLGLSCIRSQTNIKSCVNLERICELGTSMSQRRESIEYVSGSTARRRYYVPTGLISTDDIVDQDFRAMFASMNMRRLIATGIDTNTSYPKYEFSYANPYGFNGELIDYVYGSGSTASTYNTKDARQLGVSARTGTHSDISDDDLYGDTRVRTRTLETPLEDYYNFRFGLYNGTYQKPGDSNKLTYIDLMRKYAYWHDSAILDSGATVAMPQYENSYYFYFGLKEGATAIDEFKHQFFSECPIAEEEKHPTMSITKPTMPECSQSGNVIITLFDMTGPYEYSLINTDTGAKIIPYSNSGVQITNAGDTFIIDNLIDGNYQFSVTDVNYVTLKAKFNISIAGIIVNMSFKDMDIRLYNETGGSIYESYREICNINRQHNNGFIEIENNVIINKISRSLTGAPGSNSCCFVVVEEGTNAWSYTNNNYDANKIINGLSLSDGVNVFANVDITADAARIYLWDAGEQAKFDVYLCFVCGGDYVFRKIKTYNPLGIELFDTYLGCKLLPYYKTKNNFSLRNLRGNWWDDIDALPYNNTTKWAIRHFIVKQSINSGDTFNSKVYCISPDGNLGKYALFGQPENSNGLYELNPKYFSYKDSDKFRGYEINDSFSKYSLANGKKPFSKIGILDDKIVSNNDTSISISYIEYDIVNGANILFAQNALDPNYYLSDESGVVIKIVRLDGSNSFNIFYGTVTGTHEISFYSSFDYSKDYADGKVTVEIHPTFRYPVKWAPFSVSGITAIFDCEKDSDNNKKVCVLTLGNVKNGNTYEGRFNSLKLEFAGMDDIFNDCIYTSIDDIEKTTEFYLCTSANTGTNGITDGKIGALVIEGAPEGYEEDADLNSFSKLKLEERNSFINVELPTTITTISADTNDDSYYVIPDKNAIAPEGCEIEYFYISGRTLSFIENNFYSGGAFRYDLCFNNYATTKRVIDLISRGGDNFYDITDEVNNNTPILANPSLVLCSITNNNTNQSIIRVYSVNL